MKTMKLISEKELESLLISQDILERLIHGGVTNWEWYSESLNDTETFGKTHIDWKEIDLSDLLREYPSCNTTEFDNYSFE